MRSHGKWKVRWRSPLAFGYMYGLLWVRRNPLSLVWLFSTPLTILFLLYVLAGERAFPHALVGAYVALFAGTGIYAAGDASWLRLELKLQDFFVASPVSKVEYALGVAMAEAFFSSPGAVVLLLSITAYFNAGLTEVLVAVLVAILTWLSSSAIGLCLSTYVSNVRVGWQLSALLSFILTIIPPVFYPLDAVPMGLKPFAYVVPTTYASELLRQTLGLSYASPFSVMVNWALLMSFTIALTSLALLKMKWREE